MEMTQPAIKIVSLAPSVEAFGLAMDYLSRHRPFADYSVRNLAIAVRIQLQCRQNLAAINGDEIVGYAGWLITNETRAQHWLERDEPLIQETNPSSRAAALTIVVSGSSAVTRRLIRGARELNKDIRVYFKRDYPGEKKHPKKASVLNRSPSKRSSG
ncbi:MAG: hypothetical protein AAF982_07865 [Pseudomonadota bacterium]